MKWILRISILFAFNAAFALAGAERAEARKFDIKTERFATYFGGGFGVSNLSDHAFGQAAGNGVHTDQIVRSNFSGEFGVILTADPATLRIAGEYLMARSLTGAKAYSGTTEFYEFDSKVSAFVPMAMVESTVWKALESRAVLGGGIGYAMVSLDQTYRLTSDGTTGLGVSSYTEKATAQVLAWRAYLAFETLFVDTTTVNLELGYRNIKVGALQSSKDTMAISGSQTTGSDLLNSDGSNRAFDLGGGYLNVYFRFYL